VTSRPLVTVTVEEAGESSFVILYTDRGAEVRYGPFRSDGVEAAISHLGSALAMMAMRYQTVQRGANFGGKLHQQGLPPETPDTRREIAAGLAVAMARDGISRPLFADMLGFLGTPIGRRSRRRTGGRRTGSLTRPRRPVRIGPVAPLTDVLTQNNRARSDDG